MFTYEVVPFVITRGAGGPEADQEWAALRNNLNQHGRQGFRVIAVAESQEGRAVIMERQTLAEEGSVAQAAEDITRNASRAER